MKKLIPPNIRLIGPPLLLIMAIIVAAVVVFKIGISQITQQIQKIKEGKEEKNVLTQKEGILSEVQENIPQTADLVLTVIPGTNSSLSAISQIKALASEKGLIISNLSVGSGANDEKKLNKAALNFDVEGDAPSIVDFLNSIPSVAPLMLLDSTSISTDKASSKATVSVGTYWASLPKTISAVGDEVSSLTDEEIGALEIFATLRLPIFTSLEPQGPNAREDPFN